MRLKKQLLAACLLALLFACNNESGAPKKAQPSAIFADYRISGDESKAMVTCLLQFYEAGPEGTSILLQPPAGVQLDGEALTPDSALRTGAYYELQKPLETFSGKHTITLTDEHGQPYTEEVHFEPLVLHTQLGATVRRDSLVLQVSGLLPGEKVRVLLTDIDFDTDDINHLQTVRGGKIVLTAAELRQLASGPVTLMLYKELERDLKKGTAAGGRLSITYGLSREFELVD